MLGSIVFFVLILVELGFVAGSLLKKSNFRKEKAIERIVLFCIFLFLIISPIIDWSFAWWLLGVLLGVQAVWGILVLALKKGNAEVRRSKTIFLFIGKVFLIGMVMAPILVFPSYEPINTTGRFSVSTKSFTLTDKSRNEQFTKDVSDKRKVTIQFWYPSELSGQGIVSAEDRYPLVIFSHGAFGLRSSNYSTYQELAGNGYVVVSIDHTYHSFMTKQEDGKTILTNMDFMNDAMKAQNGDLDANDIYQLEQEWMELRTEDIAFVLEYIKEKTASEKGDSVFQIIDLQHIGLFGHSLGGAAAAQIGREDDDVDAVIVIDGTMLGEITGIKNDEYILTDVPYPKPILNLYNEKHFEEAVENPGYANSAAHKNALNSYQVVIKRSGHMNFTDLPIVSPYLANLLGTGNVDARECIETTNKVILQFFDRYLKSSNVEIPKERVY